MAPTLPLTSGRAQRSEGLDGYDGRAAHSRAAREGLERAERSRGAEIQHSRLREPREDLGQRDEGDWPRVKIGPIAARFNGRCSSPTSTRRTPTRSAARARAASRASPRAAPRSPRRRRGRDAAALRRAGTGRRQDRPARRAADRRQRQADGRPVLRPFHRAQLSLGDDEPAGRAAGRGPSRCQRAEARPPAAISLMSLIPPRAVRPAARRLDRRRSCGCWCSS